ncbi:MAG: valine--tRNA ligase [Candidatus Micrarchaeota archaeon]|nr:valine--tRNA ligase [Candidatus Micrarchaeota archaeon]
MDAYDKKIEEKWMEIWYSTGIYEYKEIVGKPIYIIDTPPPFTSGKLHMGHVLSYSLFDFAARFKRMCGFNVLYPQGWDTQGFPTEVKVEAKYGKGLPREEFVKRCVEWTYEYIDVMRNQMKRMGFSADWKREYITMTPEYHKKVQLSLLKMYGQNLVYKGSHPVFWCTDCRSAIAKSETEDVERETKLNYLKFKLEDGADILIATTRPEYLHACVAVFVHPDDERYAAIVGRQIETPLGRKVKILTDVDVDKEFGTGAVMVCTFGDKQDVVWAYRHNLPIIDAIDDTGRLINAGEFDGLKLKEAREKILEKLQAEGKVVKVEPLRQVIKAHDRCKKPIELKNSDQWFCKVDGFQRDIIKAAKEMRWIPEFTLQYLIDWTNFVEWDWVISRQRHFGTPLPFYVCKKCGATKAADESELPFKPETAKKGVKCTCGNEMVAEQSTCDCWVDSSITPLIIAGWPNPGWEKYYPSTLRPQGIEIIRSWAFYTIYRCLMLTGKAPFKELLLNGNVLGPDNKKMSKSLGNIVDPLELIDKYSADAVRLWVAMSGSSTHDRPFNYQDMKFAQSFINKVWNAARFVEVACKDYTEGEAEYCITDKWILSKFERIKENASKAYEEYDYFNATNTVQNFFWHDFCDNYLEFVKHRIYGADAKSKRAAQETLLKVLGESLKLLAPVMAFTTEEIYSHLFAKREGCKSIHLCAWPKSEPARIDIESENAGDVLELVIGEIRKYKSTRKMSLKDEIPKLKIGLPHEKLKYAAQIRSEVASIGKISDVEFAGSESLGLVE